MEFWELFEERFGPVGRDPAAYYRYEIGHILHIGPRQLGDLTPGDLVGAINLFDFKYRDNG